jgi:hypothetical protein
MATRLTVSGGIAKENLFLILKPSGMLKIPSTGNNYSRKT